MVSLTIAAIGMYFMGGRTALRTSVGHPGRFVLAVLLTIFLRAGVLAWMLRIPECPVILAAIMAAVVAGGLIRSAMMVDQDCRDDGGGWVLSWHNPVIALLIYSVLLRLVYLGLPELLHEEAYYWNYSSHLAMGYLDHPPMVAWIIRVFTALLGHTELGVRMGAFFSWIVGAWYVFKLTRHIFDTATAICALLLFAVLPVYFVFGMAMLPDAPLTACWAGALYYFYRALIDEDPAAWLGAGFFMGAGMLSKYTMVLPGIAVVVFMFVDSRARRWFRQRPAYVAAGLALLLFLPVIFWNFQNSWISFAFQGPRRVAGSFDFDLPDLLASIAVLLTPVGMAAAAVAVFSRIPLSPRGNGDGSDCFRRGFHLLTLLTLLPFSVFLAFSLFRNTKLNWTGPLWLGVLPYMARMMTIQWPAAAGRWRVWLTQRTWRTTTVVLLLIYGAGLHYLVLGLWRLPYPQNQLGLGWPEMAANIEKVAEQVKRETGQPPLVVGMDVDRLNSWLAFYRSRTMAGGTGRNTGAAALDTAGPHLFGRESHMYRLWFPPWQQKGDRPMILVGRSQRELIINQHLQRARHIREVVAGKNGQVTWRLYYRVLYSGHYPKRSDR